MIKIQKFIEKSQEYWQKTRNYVQDLRDPRRIGTLGFLVLVFLVSWSGLRAIQTNYILQQQVYQLQKTNEVKKLENDNVQLTNDYYKTSQYLDVTARQTLGLASPGETVLLVSKDVALEHTVSMPVSKDESATDKTKPFWQSNFESWINFFLNRSST